MFVNRENEIKRLTRALKREEAQVIVIWGRRRCGKTGLLREVLNDESILFTADLRESPLQIAALATDISRLLPGFNQVIYPDWETLLLQLNQMAKHKLVLCLDEFPYLVKNNQELPSILQKLIDHQSLDNIHIILCGSSQQMMQGIALNSSSPLFGRCTEILRISPMEPKHLATYLQTDPANTIREFGIWGGVPRYWEIRKSTSSLEEAVKYHILDRHGILFEEPERIFADEMRTSVQSWSILNLIATGSHRLSEIAGRLGKPATQLSRLLNFLIDLGYIRREIPFGVSAKSSKRSLYKIDDPFLNFYFRFVMTHKSRLELGQEDQVGEQITLTYNQYISEIWEEVCRKAVPKLFEHISEFYPASRWWGTGLNNKRIEIDLVAESVDGKYLIIGEVKWSEKENFKTIENKLDQLINQLPFISGQKIIKALFVKKAAQNSEGEMMIFSPKEIING